MKRIITSLLALAMLFSIITLASCAKQENEPPVGEHITIPKTYLDNLPEYLSFADALENQKTVTFAYVEGTNGTFTARSIKVEEITGDSVDTKLYERNETIQRRFGIIIEALPVATSINGLQNAVKPILQAGDPDYDIIAGYQYYDLNLVEQAFLIDISTLDQYEADYIDIEADYWATDYIKNMHCGNSIFWLSGDISLRFVGGQYCTFVNSRIYDSVLKEKYGSIYNIVNEGKWTLDMFSEMASLCYRDLNTNDKPDLDDILGSITAVGNDMSDAFAVGAGVTWSTRNADGTISVTLGGTRTMEFAAKYYNIVKSSWFLAPPNSDSVTEMTTFANGTVAFTVNKLYQSEVYLREMNDDFYIIPTPKFNEAQSEYRTALHDGNTIFGITYCSDAIPAAAVALEAMSAESLRIVTPEFYEFALKFKYTRDDEASEMIDLIKQCAYSDFVFVWGGSLNNATHFFRNPTPNPLSQYKKMESNLLTNLNTLIETLSANNTYE